MGYLQKVKDLSTENFQKFLNKLRYDNKLLVLEVTHGGMGGHGLPIWYVDIYGFDYSILA